MDRGVWGSTMKTKLLLGLVAGLIVAGCAGQQVLTKNGQEYGATKGVFHGRWWNYYERGVSYLAGEFYTEAEADFRKALEGRSRDTWQARQYGLHFTEYFPNRELGVVCFKTGRLDEAEKCLQDSLAQVDTDRAQYFLAEVKRAKIAKGELKDTSAPALTLPIGFYKGE